MFPIVDTHCHVYPAKVAAKAMAATNAFYEEARSKETGMIDDLLVENGKAGITHTIICSVATTPHQVSVINRYIASLVSEHPSQLTGFGTLHPDSQTMEEDLEEAISLGLKGVKLHPDIQKSPMNQVACLRAFRACEGKVPVLVHTGDPRFHYSNPEEILPVLEKYPNLVLIGAHFGCYRNWEKGPQELYHLPNFYVDCSSSLQCLSPERAVEIIRGYGADHVLFGTDYPMWNPKTEVERFLALPLTEEEKHCILYKNASQLLHLSY